MSLALNNNSASSNNNINNSNVSITQRQNYSRLSNNDYYYRYTNIICLLDYKKVIRV